MLISHIHRFIYLKTMKTGGTSVEIYFERFCTDPSREFEEQHSRDEEVSRWGVIGCRQRSVEGQTWYNHLPGCGVRELMGPKIWNDYYKFCVVRDPFDKVVSIFWFRLPDPIRMELQHAGFEVVRNRFLEWVRAAALPQDRSIYMIDDAPAMDRFVRYETLHASLKRVCQDLALPWEPHRLGRYKSGFRLREEHFSLYYDREAADRVGELYRWEIDYFGYPKL
jgi:hypothetical protein